MRGNLLSTNESTQENELEQQNPRILTIIEIILRDYKKGSQYFSSRTIILGPQVPSMAEYLVEVDQAMNLSCVKGSEDPVPKVGALRVSCSICHDTALSFDLEPAWQLEPNSCHRAVGPHPSA
jgi:hypothetical protein